jgi:hypothetical protein
MKISISLKRNLLAAKRRRIFRVGASGWSVLENVAALTDELQDDVIAYDEHVYNCETCE